MRRCLRHCGCRPAVRRVRREFLNATRQQNCQAGDIDCDGHVNGADLAMLLAAWRTPNPLIDLDDDGAVGGADLAILLASWTS